MAGVAGVGFVSGDRIRAPPLESTANYNTLAHLAGGTLDGTNITNGGLRHERSAVLECDGTPTGQRCVGVALEHKSDPENGQPVLAACSIVLSYDSARVEKQRGMIWRASNVYEI